MRCRWPELAAVAALLATGAAAQQVREIGFEALGTSSDPFLAVAGPYAALRLSDRTRVSVGLGGGVADQEFAWRGELLGHFLLSPERRRGWGAYFAGGLAAVGGPLSQGYLVLTLGLEQRPGAGAGWFVEGGVGGGARVALGYRWRRFPDDWVK